MSPPIPLRWVRAIRVTGQASEQDGAVVTETREPTIIDEAKGIIDKFLASTSHRELVSTDEVADLLLDVRLLLDTDEAEALLN
jgi:hypothetical protein